MASLPRPRNMLMISAVVFLLIVLFHLLTTNSGRIINTYRNILSSSPSSKSVVTNFNIPRSAKAPSQSQQQPGVVAQQPLPPTVPLSKDLLKNLSGIGVNVVPSYPTSVTHPLRDCVPLPQSPKPDVKICVYTIVEDQWVSGALRRGELWEGDLIFNMKAVLETDPKMQLVDLGSNIGEFTLFGAAMGRPVLAVDMLPSNVLALQTSLQLSGLSAWVTVVHNAIYRDRRNFGIVQYKGNIGGTALDTKNGQPSGGKDSVMKSVLLDDLLPLVDRTKPAFLKLDIETSEHHAIAGGQKFLASVDVPVIQMEWNAKPLEDRKEIDGILTNLGYVASRKALVYDKVDVVNFTASMNVYFVKRSFLEKLGQNVS